MTDKADLRKLADSSPDPVSALVQLVTDLQTHLKNYAYALHYTAHHGGLESSSVPFVMTSGGDTTLPLCDDSDCVLVRDILFGKFAPENTSWQAAHVYRSPDDPAAGTCGTCGKDTRWNDGKCEVCNAPLDQPDAVTGTGGWYQF